MSSLQMFAMGNFLGRISIDGFRDPSMEAKGVSIAHIWHMAQV